ncbi:protein adenylyltransferase SelO [Brachybacterium timonense]|uniref:protein adenylyltransferase SelO n=1 Tax=Brachybacterium timonense TaxID=2050896 RepID=UPI0014826CF9|nr:protein adenylyltransferase SelO family protein [Brachybacterium timonense]
MSTPPLQRTYAAAVPELSTPHHADRPPQPQIVQLNEQLAQELGLDVDWLHSPAGIALLTGQLDADGRPLDPQREPERSSAEPRPVERGAAVSADATDASASATAFTTAQAYAGHQFGQPAPVLGDGRAVLLGELIDTHGQRQDLHLKGCGRTPFSRPGSDGKAPLGPMLRELVIGESLHALRVPTSRILAVLTTGERIRPRRGVTPERGALAVRVAASHLRVGTVQYAAWHHGPAVIRAVVDQAITRHHAAAAEADDPSLALLDAVVGAQARLVATWMLTGFVHGVMNTDNMTLSGQSIDHGPCAFLDAHRSDAVFSSIDTGGRYAYGAQPQIALWNLSRLAEALLSTIGRPGLNDPATAADGQAPGARPQPSPADGEPPSRDSEPDAQAIERSIEQATAVLEHFAPRYRAAWIQGMAAKLGLPDPGLDRGAADAIEALGVDLLQMMETHGLDHTATFRALADQEQNATADDADATDANPGRTHADRDSTGITTPGGTSALPDVLHGWLERLRAQRGTGPQADAARAAMTAVNPVYIPRAAHLDAALRAAELGDLAPVERLLEAVRSPFSHRPDLADLELPPPDAPPTVTFCGT